MKVLPEWRGGIFTWWSLPNNVFIEEAGILVVVRKRKTHMAKRKLKNHSGASKRFKRTGSGKWMRRKAGLRHILTSKAPGVKSRLSGAAVVSKEDQYSLSRLLPYK